MTDLDHPVTKRRARQKLDYAVRTGQIQRRAACERCGQHGRIDAHHDDHSQPLCVAWLCRKCHAAVDTHYGRPRRGPYGGRVRDLPRLTIRASQPVLDRYKEMRDQSRLTEHEFFKRMVEHYATEGL